MTYDDNFGHWKGMDNEEMREFYNQVQKESVLKKCEDCGETVRIRRSYCICNSCAEMREYGQSL
jgi:hypothetical protein